VIALIQHGQVILNRDIVGDRIAAAQRVPATWHARIQRLPDMAAQPLSVRGWILNGQLIRIADSSRFSRR